MTGKICISLIVLSAAALAQSRMVSGPAPAVAGPSFDVSLGYSRLNMSSPSGNVALNGVDSAASVGLSPRWGAMIDTSYLRASNVFDTHHQAYALSVRGGPVFYPFERGNTRAFLHGLAGGSLIDGAVLVNDTQFFHGWLLRPSFAAGGGVEHWFPNGFALRGNLDYVRTTFYSTSGTAQGQNNLQFTVSWVFHLKERPHNRSRVR